MAEQHTLPNAFIWRRLHSLTGLFLVLYIIEHLLVNSQAALFIGDDGRGFVHSVNHIHDLPYLRAIEFFLLGVPILVHMWWGVVYLRTGKQNYYGESGSKPILEYPRNRAYTWQRITSWILLFGIIAHVIHMRFIEYPKMAEIGSNRYYMVRLDLDSGLYTLAQRLGFELYNIPRVYEVQKEIDADEKSTALGGHGKAVKMQKVIQDENFLRVMENPPLKPGEVIAVANSFGVAELLMVRETFKMPLMLALYTIFVLSACFHGFNGLWTFLITWGVTLTERSQQWMLKIATGLMVLVAFLGLSAIWLTYWINLKQ